MSPLVGQPRIVVLNWRDASHPRAGGAEVYCENVARELAAGGARVTYVTAAAPGTPATERRDGYTIVRRGGSLTVYVWVLVWLLLHRRRIDGVIDSQNGIPFFAPLALGRAVPVALVIHHVHQTQFGVYLPKPAAAIARWAESTLTRVVYGSRPICVVSPSSRTEVRRQLRLTGPIFLLPNGGARVELSSGPRAGHPSVVCVGRLVPHKRWDEVIAACIAARSSVPGLTLDLVGGGPALHDLRRQVRRTGAESFVTVHGFVDAATRDGLVESGWVTVSASDGEGWGLSVIEAAAHGLPAVAVDVPGLRDSVIAGQTGWLCPREDLATTVVDAVVALADTDRASAYAERCRSWAAAHTWESTANRFRAVLAAERGRLDAEDTARVVRHDTHTLIELGPDVAAAFDPAVLRGTDQLTFCAHCLPTATGPFRVLLAGADELGALRLLDRMAIGGAPVGADVRLCRSSELLTWAGDGHLHNVQDLAGGTCPALRARADR